MLVPTNLMQFICERLHCSKQTKRGWSGIINVEWEFFSSLFFNALLLSEQSIEIFCLNSSKCTIHIVLCVTNFPFAPISYAATTRKHIFRNNFNQQSPKKFLFWLSWKKHARFCETYKFFFFFFFYHRRRRFRYSNTKSFRKFQ